MPMLEYDPVVDMKRSYDAAVDAKRAELIEDVRRLREEAIDRVTPAIRRGFTSRDQARNAFDETLAWLSEADLGLPNSQAIMFRAHIRKLILEFAVLEGR